MADHIWKGYVPVCANCGCTSLEAQYKQPETKGVGPCPLKTDRQLAERLLNEWSRRECDRQERMKRSD